MKSRNFEMKHWVALLGGVFLLSSCQPPAIEKVEEPESPIVVQPNAPKVGLPLDRTITNSGGKQISVTITGKSFDKVQFKRKSDGKKYVVPISTLSVADQQFLTTVESSDEASFEDDGRSGGLTPVLQVKLKSAEKRLIRVVEDMEKLEATKRGSNLARNSPRLRGMDRELSLMQEERVKLELEIAELKSRE